MKNASGEEISKSVFLAGIRDKKMTRGEADSLAKELSSLVDTLGFSIASQEIVYVRESSAKYGMGVGKALELAEKAASCKADCIVFDRDISPSQQRNWEELAGMPVIDRQELIIQIFASRARTREAELQVSLAELFYALPRLKHKYIDLARQRGGRYGTRGAGETRLETDRRSVEKQIHKLEEELEEVKRQRQVQRQQRERRGIPICSLVGYTNSGKSSILNALTGANVLTEDKLFATLDSTVRRKKLPLGREVLIVDTVGFIRRLPHSLINAFRSTLEEVNHSDLILIVLDSADAEVEAQYKTTLSVLSELNAANIPVITILNKIDKLEAEGTLALLRSFPESVPISAAKGLGLEDLCQRIEKSLQQNFDRSL